MATKLAPAHRELDGQPIKTTDVARVPARKHPRAGDRTPKRMPALAWEDEEED